MDTKARVALRHTALYALDIRHERFGDMVSLYEDDVNWLMISCDLTVLE